MAGIDKSEIWCELDATDEAFVRRKHALGKYGSSRSKVVEQWLAVKDAERQAAYAAAEENAVRTMAFWTKVGAIVSAAGVFVTLVITLLSRVSL